MAYYSAWYEPVTQTVTISDGSVPGIPVGSTTADYYARSTGANQTNAQRGLIVAQVMADHPQAGHAYDGTTVTLDQAVPVLSLDPPALNSYLMTTTPAGAVPEVDVNATVTGATAQVYLHPLSYTGGDTTAVFSAGTPGGSPGSFWIESDAGSDTVTGTWNYGALTPVRINDQLMIPFSGSYSVSSRVWDQYATRFNGVSVVAGANATCVLTISFVVEVQTPRYRFFFPTLPPLRQYPRDDALGGTPRQGRASRSVQSSTRQGWIGAYR